MKPFQDLLKGAAVGLSLIIGTGAWCRECLLSGSVFGRQLSISIQGGDGWALSSLGAGMRTSRQYAIGRITGVNWVTLGQVVVVEREQEWTELVTEADCRAATVAFLDVWAALYWGIGSEESRKTRLGAARRFGATTDER